MKRVTLRDVAQAAGVSASAVSRTFTPGASIAAQTRDRVLAAAKSLGYRPNAIARGLISNRTDLVALVTGTIASPYDPLLVDALARGLARIDKRIMLLPVDGATTVADAMEIALDYRVSGAMVAAGTMTAETSRRFASLGVPLVLAGRIGEGELVDCVCSDNLAGGRSAASLLARTGHRRIAYLGRTRNTFSDQERFQGLVEGLARHGLTLHAERRIEEAAEDLSATMAILGGDSPPDALFCVNDALAMQALEASRLLGIRVPEDLAVIGYDDIPQARWPSFRLTTIAYPVPVTVAAILERLAARIADPTRPRSVTRIPAELVVRDTTRRLSP
ncbi:MAG: LacI family DNA-binding transcriptional regulator [Alphaproteobacteria bacterium]